MLDGTLLPLFEQHQRWEQTRVSLVALEQMHPDRKSDGRDSRQEPWCEKAHSSTSSPYVIPLTSCLCGLPGILSTRHPADGWCRSESSRARQPWRGFEVPRGAHPSCGGTREPYSQEIPPSCPRFPNLPLIPDFAALAGSPPDRAREKAPAHF